MDNERQGNGLVVLLAFFTGGLIGSLLGLLFAPMAGRETRERIRDASTDVKERTITAAHQARDATAERVTDLVDKGESTSRRRNRKCKSCCRSRQVRFCRKEVGTGRYSLS